MVQLGLALKPFPGTVGECPFRASVILVLKQAAAPTSAGEKECCQCWSVWASGTEWPTAEGHGEDLPGNGTSGRATRSLGRGGCHRKRAAVAAEMQVMGRASAQRAGMWTDGGRYQILAEKGECFSRHSGYACTEVRRGNYSFHT